MSKNLKLQQATVDNSPACAPRIKQMILLVSFSEKLRFLKQESIRGVPFKFEYHMLAGQKPVLFRYNDLYKDCT